MSAETQRLQQLYAGFEDDQLFNLSQDAENLTPDAQVALREELKRRSLTGAVSYPAPDADASAEPPMVEAHDRADAFGVGVPGLFPGAGPAVEQALEPGGDVHAGMTALVSLYDGLELSRACEALEDAGIDPAIEEIAGDPTTGTATRFEIWIGSASLEHGKRVLRAKMGLFPLAEVDTEDPHLPSDLGDGTVGQFENAAEAIDVQQVLAAAGIHAIAEEDGDLWLVKVDPADHERALTLLEENLGL